MHVSATLEQPQPDVSLSEVDEVDGHSKSVAGVRLEAVRTGRGVGPNRVLTVEDERFTMTSCDIGFPIMARTTIGDDRILLAHVAEARPGSRWCEIDLFPGAVVAYGPGAEHTAVNHSGLRFSFTIAAQHELARLADRLELDIEQPRRGEVHLLAPSGASRALGVAMQVLSTDAVRPGCALGRQTDDVLRDAVGALAEPDRVRRVGRRSRIDSRHVVHQGIDYANATGRIPSINELCLASHLSERRLRKAYNDEFDVSPTGFFRAWALDAARRRLRCFEPHESTVAVVATDLGFSHLGRFAGYYRHTFGESPSETLTRPAG